MKRAAIVAGLWMAASVVHAQTWPNKPVRILIAATAGSTTDLLSRALAEPLTRSLGQPIIVENRVGADGVIGTEACVRAAPDGHTVCGTASNVIVWNTVLRAKLPYDVVRDLAPIIHAGFFDSALVIHPSVPATSVQQYIDYARANPGKVNWGYFGANSTGYIYMAWLNQSRGASFYPVPYKTQLQNLQAVTTGEISSAVQSLSQAGPLLKSGKLRALAVTANQRVDWLPGVPTFEEDGIKLPLRTWFGYHYQAAVPKELVARMNRELRQALESPAIRNGFVAKIGLNLNTGSPEAFDAYIRDQLKAVSELVAYIGLKPE
jgi:tripartite-type tricarboxylate transporter receptor subunit TctC